GSSCTVTARANSGYSFDGWYEGSSKVSSSASYTFTVSSNRTLCFHLT
ncbi:InlB B-repeat-containing protein, partial [Bacteroides uniformis]